MKKPGFFDSALLGIVFFLILIILDIAVGFILITPELNTTQRNIVYVITIGILIILVLSFIYFIFNQNRLIKEKLEKRKNISYYSPIIQEEFIKYSLFVLKHNQRPTIEETLLELKIDQNHMNTIIELFNKMPPIQNQTCPFCLSIIPPLSLIEKSYKGKSIECEFCGKEL